MHCANVVAVLQKMCRKRVTERVAAGALGQASSGHGLLDRTLDDGLVDAFL